MSNNNDIKPRLKAVLERHQGRNSAITRRELRLMFGLTDKKDRKLRLMIGELRAEGLPILFATEKPAGYYLPETWTELYTGLDAFQSYIKDFCIQRAYVKKAGAMYLKPASQERLL